MLSVRLFKRSGQKHGENEAVPIVYGCNFGISVPLI